jgi:hypothetical protein
MKPLLTSLTVIAATLAGNTSTGAQTLYGLNSSAGSVVEFSSMAAGPCMAPGPTVTTAFPYIVPPLCGGPMAGLTPPPGVFSFGDIAADRLTNTIYVCDGFVIEQYTDYSPLSTVSKGSPLNSFLVPPIIGLPITGMGMDSAGITTGGIPVLYVTDGFLIMGIAPSLPGTCAAAIVVVAPFPTPFPMPAGAMLSDLTLDPSTASLLACDTAGMIHSIGIGGFFGPYGLFPGFPVCGLMPTLQGIAMDLATTPSAIGSIPAFYVTDGFLVGYVDVTGAPAASTFYTPTPCNLAPAPLNGLAYAAHSVNYGTAPGSAKLKAFGQSSSPGPTYGLEILGIPAPGGFIWLLTSTNIGGLGFFCPPLFAAGNPLYVDIFAATGSITPLFATPGPGAVIPLPLPAGLPPGVEVYIQAFIDLTPGVAGGPWMSTNAVDMVITAP